MKSLRVEDDIRLNDKNHIRRIIGGEEGKWMFFFLKKKWFNAHYPQPACVWLHHQARTFVSVGTEGGAYMEYGGFQSLITEFI